MERIEELVRGRRSVRTYDEREIEAELLKKFTDFMGEIKNPYGVPVTFRLLDGRQQPLKCPVAVGTHLFVGAKAPRVPHMEEAVGFSMETLILYAQSLGLGSVWVGGTMDRPAFERAMELGPEERMPCMSPPGLSGRKDVRPGEPDAQGHQSRQPGTL